MDKYRPIYHFLPPANWMIDPSGLIHYRGEYLSGCLPASFSSCASSSIIPLSRCSRSISTHVYPLKDESDRITIFAAKGIGGVKLERMDIWKMNSIW
jgi:hypothetical protein